ncbi:MAG: VOC family protein [Alphaproteobacteria bacterium]|nr:VOC family protein [Alphaproteobacteria bacterium]
MSEPAASDPDKGAVVFHRTIPILRIFDEEKARAFYLDFLGFTLDWEHRFEEDAPLYCQVSRDGLTLHLSEHHGDACPGSTVFVAMRGVDALHREASSRGYRYLRPGIEDLPWGRVMTATDPFGNRLRFCEPSG